MAGEGLNLGGIGSFITSWFLNPVIWIIIIFVILAATWGFLKIRKRRKLLYECLELVNLGERTKNPKFDGASKFGHNILKCGWFGKKKALRGLWDSGEEQLETQDGEIIYGFSTEDFQEVNGKRGVVAFRDPVNQNILVPIDRASIKNGEMLAEIAPQEFRDVAVEIIKDADRETSDYKEKLIQWLMFAGIIVFALVAIIVVTQMVKNGQQEASSLIVQAGETCLKNAQEVCSKFANAATGSAP